MTNGERFYEIFSYQIHIHFHFTCPSDKYFADFGCPNIKSTRPKNKTLPKQISTLRRVGLPMRLVFYFDCALDFNFNSLIKICKKLIENKRRLYLGALIFLELLINNFNPSRKAWRNDPN